MNRRDFIAGLGIATMSCWAKANDKIPVVGVLLTHVPVIDESNDEIRAGLRKYGWEDGRNIRLEVVSAEGQLDRVQTIANEFVAKGVSVILTFNEFATRAAMKATTSIPIVMVGYVGDPIKLGLVDSIGRPKGNVTGIHAMSDTLGGKRLEILKDALPRMRRVAVLRQPPFAEEELAEVHRAAALLNIRVSPMEIKGADDFEPAFRRIKELKATGVMSLNGPIFYIHRHLMGKLSLKYKVPMIAIAGSEGKDTLLAYGTDSWSSYRRSGYYIHRLLTDSKPSDLPIEEISTFKMMVNMKAAKALGIKLPQTVLVQASDVIE